MKYFTDGYTEFSNPSLTGGGFTITDNSGNLIKTQAIKKVKFTNNEAELLGVRECLDKICEYEDEISTDSNIVICWLREGNKKIYKSKFPRPDLISVIEECRAIIKSKNINLYWEGREKNLAGIFNENNSFDEIAEYVKEKEETENLFRNL